MSQIYRIRHRSWCVYERIVSFARCNVRLCPIDWPDQRLIDFTLTVAPGDVTVAPPERSGLVNLSRLIVSDATSWLDVTSVAQVEVTRPIPVALPDDPVIRDVATAARESCDPTDLSPANFLYPSPQIPADSAIAAWAGESLAPDRSVVDAAYDLSWRIYTEFRYDTEATDALTLPAEAFAKRAGVCQDFAQVMICGLRAAGIPAAYVSGYIRTEPAPGEAKLMGSDAMHGWVLVWCGDARGWIGFDPTNGIYMAEDHVLVAIGRDYLDIAPLDGIFTGSGEQSVTVEVDVTPVIKV
jgi:transglutaminase-like putative cysteine protease